MLFIPKDKVEGDYFDGSPLSLKQVRLANPNISIPEITLREMQTLKKVADDLGYEVLTATKMEDLLPLVGDSFKERKLTVTGCTKESGEWERIYKPEKIHGGDLTKYRNALRGKRDELLAKSDWTQTSDSPLSDEQKAEWRTYRQQLRDLPEKYDHPVWCKYPDMPKEKE